MYSVLCHQSLLETIKPGDVIHFSVPDANFVSKDALLAERGLDAEPDDPEAFSEDEVERMARKGLEEGEV